MKNTLDYACRNCSRKNGSILTTVYVRQDDPDGCDPDSRYVVEEYDDDDL